MTCDDPYEWHCVRTLTAKRYSPDLQRFSGRSKKRRGRRKVIMSTARKLLGVMYWLSKHDWMFKDIPHLVFVTHHSRPE